MTLLQRLLLDSFVVFAFLLLGVSTGNMAAAGIAWLFPAAPGDEVSVSATKVLSLFCLASGATLGALVGTCIGAKLR